jgi:hypothetical protein
MHTKASMETLQQRTITAVRLVSKGREIPAVVTVMQHTAQLKQPWHTGGKQRHNLRACQ